MNSEVLLLGVIVGGVNYLFRYLPLRLRAGHARPARRGPVSVLLDTIGIASICALLVVSSVPEILADAHRLAPTLTGFLVLGAAFWKTRSIIVPTLLSAFAYGLAWKNHQRVSKLYVSILVNNSFDLFVTIVIISAVINEVIPKWIVRLLPLSKCSSFAPAAMKISRFRRSC
ncbi:branched-chain amino acid transporter AzlD [Klebsiella pneumoniae]|nr:branched-chain amino acid transporter AzlD [Klebsiella pneumoniae]